MLADMSANAVAARADGQTGADGHTGAGRPTSTTRATRATSAGRARVRNPARPARLAGRLVRLYLGLAGFGVSLALMVRARLGLDPWDVLHQGIARHLGVQIGWVTIGVSGIVLLAWIPLRQRPGLGTVSNAIVVGLVVNGALDVLPAPGPLAWRAVWLAAGIGLNALATACYIGAGLGPGPRDGLMTGIAARGHSIRVVRTAMEAVVLGTGWLLGGNVGIGTVLYAVSIGPLAHVFVPLFSRKEPAATSRAPATPPDEAAPRLASCPSRGPDRPRSHPAAR